MTESTDLPRSKKGCQQTHVRCPEQLQPHDDDSQQREQDTLEHVIHQLQRQTHRHVSLMMMTANSVNRTHWNTWYISCNDRHKDTVGVKKLKRQISSLWKAISELRGVTKVWCHTMLLAAQHDRAHSALTPASMAGTQFTYRKRMEGWVDPGALVTP